MPGGAWMANRTEQEYDLVEERDESPPGTPGWVKLVGIVILVLVLLFIGLHLAGLGLGPGTHVPVQHGQQP